MASKPFIIKNKIVEPMLPKDSQYYDESQQTRIQILQAMNGYLAINMLYQSFKLCWSFWHYQTECPDYAYLSLGFLAVNAIWAIISYCGFKCVRSKNSRNIKLFGYSVIFNFVIRIVMYIICGAIMHGYVPNYMNIDETQLNNIICSALYPEALYVIQGIFEGLISLLLLFLINSVYSYVKRFQNSQTQKYASKFNQMSDY